MRKISLETKTQVVSPQPQPTTITSTAIHPEWPSVNSLKGVFNKSVESDPEQPARPLSKRPLTRVSSADTGLLKPAITVSETLDVERRNPENASTTIPDGGKSDGSYLLLPSLTRRKSLPNIADRRGSTNIAAAVEKANAELKLSNKSADNNELKVSPNFAQRNQDSPEFWRTRLTNNRRGSSVKEIDIPVAVVNAPEVEVTSISTDKPPPIPKPKTRTAVQQKKDQITAAALMVANTFRKDGTEFQSDSKNLPTPIPKSRKEIPANTTKLEKFTATDTEKQQPKPNETPIAIPVRQIRTKENRLGVYSKDPPVLEISPTPITTKPIASVQPTEVISQTRELKISEIVENWPPVSPLNDDAVYKNDNLSQIKNTERKSSTQFDTNNNVNQINSILSENNKTNQTKILANSISDITSTERTDKFASILVIGLAESGKTTMIDELLDQQVPKHGRGEIVEYTLEVKMAEKQGTFHNMRVIDTPGFKSEKFGSNFARMFATLLNYCRSQEGLCGKPPNIVLFAVSFGERFQGNENCDLVQFLKVIQHFETYFKNPKFPNFIFVLTHLANAVRRDQVYPEIRVNEFKDLVKKYANLTSPIPVVCAENQGEAAGFQVEDGFYKLPNGEMYPSNLISKMKTLLTRKDHNSLSETIIRSAFGSEYPNSIQLSKTKIIPQLKEDSPAISQMKQTLKEVYSQVKIENTEISLLLQVGWENISPTLQKEFNSSLVAAQTTFQLHKIKEFADIPTEPHQVFKLLRELPQNLAVADLLIHTLQLKIPHNSQAGLFIGQGYDMTQDRGTNISPLQFGNNIFKTSPIGQIPNELQCHVTEDRAIVFKFFYSSGDYMMDRMRELGIRNASFTGHLPPPTLQRPGYNIIKENQEPTKSTVATALIEYRAVRLTLEGEEFEFKPVFWDALSSQPHLDSKIPETIQVWKDFFGCWGTHLIKSGYGGGSIEINFKGKMLSKVFSSLNEADTIPSDEDMTNRVFQWITGDGLDFAATTTKTENFMKGLSVESSILGGDDKFRDFDFMNVSYEEVTEMRNHWKQSLFERPAMLETNLVLVPISTFVRQKCEVSALKMDMAFHYIFSQFISNSEAKQSSCAIL